MFNAKIILLAINSHNGIQIFQISIVLKFHRKQSFSTSHYFLELRGESISKRVPNWHQNERRTSKHYHFPLHTKWYPQLLSRQTGPKKVNKSSNSEHAKILRKASWYDKRNMRKKVCQGKYWSHFPFLSSENLINKLP